MKKIIFFSFFLCCLPSFLIANQNQKIKITADEVSRNTSKFQTNAKGNVIATHDDVVIYADDMEYFSDTQTANAHGRVRLRDSLQYLKGENIEYDIETSSGIMRNGKLLTVPWIVFGKRMERISKDKAIIYKAKISSCDYNKKQHYYFRTNKVVVYFGKRMYAYNVVLFIRGIPVFYFPFFTASLKDSKLDISLTVGQNTRDGFYGKTEIKYAFTNDEKLTVYVDKYEYRGWGLGAKFEYKKGDVNRGSVYAYGIDDTIDDVRKRVFRLEHNQKLAQRWRSFTKINYQNDESFDNDLLYNTTSKTGASRINSNIYSYSSLNYVGKMYSMTTVWEMENDWDDSKKAYRKSKEYLPQFTIDTYQNKFFVNRLYYKAGLSFLNSYNKSNDAYYGTGSAYLNFTHTRNLTRNITLTPTTGIRENLTNRPNSAGNYEEGYATSWENSINLKNRLTRDLDISFTYTYNTGLFDKRRRIYTNSLASVMNNYFLRNKLRLTSSISYDFNTDVDSTVKRFSSLTNDARWKLAKKVTYYGKHKYNFAKRRTELLQNVLYFFPSARWTISENFVIMEKKGDAANIVDVITTLKYRPNLKWKFDFSIRNDYDHVIGEISKVRDREFALYRDLHCWELKFAVVDKNDIDEEGEEIRYREFWVTLNLKALPGQNISFYKDDRKKYYPKWYYWDLSGEAY